MSDSAPDHIFPVIGFRSYIAPSVMGDVKRQGALCTRGHPLNYDTPTKAECRVNPIAGVGIAPGEYGAMSHPEPIPYATCGCGFYGWLRIEDAIEYQRFSHSIVVGILGFGKMLVDSYFWRAEYIMPMAIMDLADMRTLSGRKHSTAPGYIQTISRAYDIPVLGKGALLAYMSRYGMEIEGETPDFGKENMIDYY